MNFVIFYPFGTIINLPKMHKAAAHYFEQLIK
jgi:hypothetical protein